MSESAELVIHAAAVREGLSAAGRGLVERQSLVELVGLAAVAREHVLVIGPPGTAKSEAVRRVSRVLGGRYFEYLLGKFTEPSEIFGPVDLRRLREGVVETQTSGMLPEADFAFLDEVFRASTAILNTLLALLNERTFRRGHTTLTCPLRVCVGASNGLPDDDTLAAFADRFLLRAFVEPVAEPELEALLDAGWSLEGDALSAMELMHLDALSAAVPHVELGEVRPRLVEAIRALRLAGITLSDRRVVKSQRLVAAAAVLAGRRAATGADLWPLVYAVPTRESQDVAREALRELLEETENATLPAAAEEASFGPRARATRLLAAGQALLASESPSPLRVEALLREIDASLAAAQRTPELDALRADLARRLESG